MAVSKVDFVFRANTQVARQTLDLYEIWDGEMVIEGGPLQKAQQ